MGRSECNVVGGGGLTVVLSTAYPSSPPAVRELRPPCRDWCSPGGSVETPLLL